MGWTFSPEITYMLRFIPLVRGGYAMAIVVGWLTYNRASGLVRILPDNAAGHRLFLQPCILRHGAWAATLWLKGYGDALWWAFMDVTTVGSNIIAVTRHRAGTVRAAGGAGHDDVPHFHSVCNEPGRAAQQGKARVSTKRLNRRPRPKQTLPELLKPELSLYPPGTTVPKCCYKR